MNASKRLVLIVTMAFLFLSSALAEGPGRYQDLQSPPAQKQDVPDLSGTWMAEYGESVTIEHNKDAGRVYALFTEDSKHGECPYGDRRTFFIDGKFADNVLKGDMLRCTRVETLVKKCGLEPVYKTTFNVKVADISQDRISGKRHTEHYAPVEGDECKFTRDPSGDRDVEFTLTRSCKTEKDKLCAATAEAFEAASLMLQEIESQTVGGQSTNLLEKLDKIRNQLCDDKDAQRKLDQVRSMVASNSFRFNWKDVAQRRNVLAQVDLILKSIDAGSCSGTASTNCQEPNLERAQMERLEKAWNELREQLRKKWQQFEAHQAEVEANVEGYRAYIATCGIVEIATKLIEFFSGQTGSGAGLVRLRDIVEKFLEDDLATLPLLDEVDELEIELDDIFEVLDNGISALGASNPANIRRRIEDCAGSVPGQSLYKSATAFIDNVDAGLKLLPEIHNLMKRMEDIDEEHWSWQHKYYDACIAYAKCKGTDPSTCPKPPEQKP